ncbi:CooT family nickel-binding protein [Halarsenatibacter silvermanii]|uniref:Predicted RNA-binding protein n=1 Tax=Halarsenatibacter silvermanii TaxID=321763 RepID=A0A1G9HEA9_9FIRM|nr:CooT family nickel-binding protein [Halarsenatibacter silvermanii]SDL10813.1 Predicted RNA-binding protein [Halarsenatibacter silvermanii]
MCQSTAYIVRDGEKELFMEDVSEIIPEKEGLTLSGLMGEEKFIEAEIQKMDLMDHEILLEERE